MHASSRTPSSKPPSVHLFPIYPHTKQLRNAPTTIPATIKHHSRQNRKACLDCTSGYQAHSSKHQSRSHLVIYELIYYHYDHSRVPTPALHQQSMHRSQTTKIPIQDGHRPATPHIPPCRFRFAIYTLFAASIVLAEPLRSRSQGGRPPPPGRRW
jgi:hypothetical protein